MNLNTIYESDIEEVSLDWLAELGYTVLHGPDIAPEAPDAERSTYNEVVLEHRLRPCSCSPESKYTHRSTRGRDPKSASPRFLCIDSEQPRISPDAS